MNNAPTSASPFSTFLIFMIASLNAFAAIGRRNCFVSAHLYCTDCANSLNVEITAGYVIIVITKIRN
jgi:hypothetical protein